MDPASHDPAALGRYRIERRLGEGAAGTVFLGVDEAGRRVAVKQVHAEQAAEPGFRDRFRREVQQAAAAPAWFTAPVLDADPDTERPWLATAYVEGPSLSAYVSEQGPLGEAGTAALAVRMADGLVAVHAAGLVHRDLKPSHVLLADDGPRLIDFGFSAGPDVAPARPGTGTVEYLSPEQAAGEGDVGPASDMFSFGSLLVFAASGRSPFAADSAAAALSRIGYGEPDLGPTAGRIREAVHACLTKDPAGRPTAAQVRGLLRAADAEAAVAGAEPTEVLPVGPAVSLWKPPPGCPPTGPGSTLTGLPPAAPPPYAASPCAAPPYAPPPYPPPARRRWLVPLVVALAVLVLAGAGLAAVRLTHAATPTAAPATAAPAPVPTSAASPSSDPAAGVTVVDAPGDPRYGTDAARFATPSRNIACSMSADEVRCDVAARTWTLPPKPADCAADYGTGAALSGPGTGVLSCVGDTVADPALAVLDYGVGVRFAGVLCVSRETGLRCENPATGHGFRVARASYELF